jgi:uncharacterized protein YjbI with pentapeptide repeats
MKGGRTARASRRRRERPPFPGNEAHLQILKESIRRHSPRFWNRWREAHPRVVPDLRGLWLAGGFLRGFDLRRARLDRANLERADLAGVHLERASLTGAHARYANLSNVHAEGADLTDADFRGATLAQGNFRGTTGLPGPSLLGTSFIHANLRAADFTEAKLDGARFSRADLTATRLDHAEMKGALLDDAILDGTSLLGTRLAEAHVYGAFIRRVKTDEETDQSGLFLDVNVVWERDRPRRRKRRRETGLDLVEFTQVDDIQFAQFHNIVDESGSVGKLLAATTRRVVLILGRFRPRRKRVLEALAEALRARGKTAVIFDFPSPQNREVSDTVRFIAGMSQFIVVDMTQASSVPLELQATIPELMVPVVPIVESGQEIFSMFADLQRRYFWIQRPVSYDSVKQLVDHVDEAIILPVQRAEREIRERRTASVRPPIGVARVERDRGRG